MPRSRRAVLVVDDEPMIQVFVRTVLAASGFQVTCAGSGEEALSIVQGEYALAICDLRLPGMSGVELIGRLRERQPELAAVLTSGVGADELAQVGGGWPRFWKSRSVRGR